MNKETFFSVFQNKDLMTIIKKFMYGGKKTSNIDAYTNGDTAAYYGYLSLMKERDLTYTDDAVSLARGKGHLEVVKYLKDRGLPIEPCVMCHAVSSGNISIVQYLISLGLKVKEEHAHYAGKSGSIEMIKFLQRKRIKLTRATNSAARYGHLNVLLHLNKCGVENGKDIEFPAGKGGNIEVVKYLYDLGCKNTKNYSLGAADGGQLNLLKYLIEAKYKISKRVLSRACDREKVNVVRYLIETKPSDIEVSMLDGVMSGNIEIVKLFIEHGYVISFDCILSSIEMDYPEVLEFLVHTDPSLIDEAIETVLDIGDEGMFNMLIKMGYTKKKYVYTDPDF